MTTPIRADATPQAMPNPHRDARPIFSATPGYGDTQWEQLHYSQAVRLGNRVDTSGQGGWDDDFGIPTDLDAEIEQACSNIERTLAAAGATWPDVVSVDSFHVVPAGQVIGPEHTGAVVAQFRRRMGARRPIWTQVGVTALGAPGMRFEIRVTAVADPPLVDLPYPKQDSATQAPT